MIKELREVRGRTIEKKEKRQNDVFEGNVMKYLRVKTWKST